jgi:uncharacterized protein (DUF924 family)
MDTRAWEFVGPEAVLDFWFPDDGHDASLEAHRAFWTWRMRGEADEAIRVRFTDLTEAAAKGLLDHWAGTPRGRLALIIVLDQFSRSVWRGTPAAFSQDIRAARLALEGFENGDYAALPNVWEKTFCLIAIAHCEGPDHPARMERNARMVRELVDAAPERLRLSYLVSEDQNRLARQVIETYGRHPHRNAVLGRISTPAEEAYIAAGEFPHQRQLPATQEELERLLADRPAGA